MSASLCAGITLSAIKRHSLLHRNAAVQSAESTHRDPSQLPKVTCVSG
jgi:hypothetical protein